MSTKAPWRVREWQRSTADLFEVEIAVEERRPVDGLTELEQRLVVRQLTGRRVSVEDIAAVIQRTPRTVYRWRAQDRRVAVSA